MSSAQDLLKIFNTRLGSHPSKLQSDAFAADLARTSHELLKSSLLEVAGEAGREVGGDLRKRTMSVFYRKLAENTRLFPMFFSFETAFRAFVAARLETIYASDRWWAPIQTEINFGRPCTLRRIEGIPVSRATLRTVEHILTGPNGNRIFDSGYEVVAAGTLAHVGQLIQQHWSQMAAAFNPKHNLRSHGRMTSGEFGQLFTLVREARNDLSHYRNMPRQLRLMEVIEELLNLLDVSARQIHTEVSEAALVPLIFTCDDEASSG